MLFLINPTPEKLQGKFDGKEYDLAPEKMTMIELDIAAIHIQEQFRMKGVTLFYPDKEGRFDETQKQAVMAAGRDEYIDWAKKQVLNFNRDQEEQARQGLPISTPGEDVRKLAHFLKTVDINSVSIKEPKKDVVFMLQQKVNEFEAKNKILEEKGESPLEEPEDIKRTRIALNAVKENMVDDPEPEKKETAEIKMPEMKHSAKRKSMEAAKQARKKEKK